jgi:hypothetical protein
VSLFTFIADLSGVAAQLRRIADALDRAYPIPPAPSRRRDRGEAADLAGPMQHHMAESPEQYQARMNNQSDLASSLGVAPWSPDFQALVDEMRKSLQQPRMEMNEDNEYYEVPGYSEAEADGIVRQAFDLAQRYATATAVGPEGTTVDRNPEP